MRTFALLVLVLLVFLATAALSADRTIGVNVHSLDPALAPAYAELGVRVVRADLPWSHVVHHDGEHWERFDAFVRALYANGLYPLLILQWDAPEPLSDPDSRARFAHFARSAARRYPLAIYEVLNEPNLRGQTWRYVEPEDYAATVAAVSPLVKREAPQALVVGPGYSAGDVSDGYLQRAFAAGLLDHLDSVSVHPYGVGSPSRAPQFYADVRALTKAYGRELSVIVSEWGFLAQERAQAALVSEALAVNERAGIGLTVVYRWDHEDGFGLVDRDGVPRASYYSVLAAARGAR